MCPLLASLRLVLVLELISIYLFYFECYNVFLLWVLNCNAFIVHGKVCEGFIFIYMGDDYLIQIIIKVQFFII